MNSLHFSCCVVPVHEESEIQVNYIQLYDDNIKVSEIWYYINLWQSILCMVTSGRDRSDVVNVAETKLLNTEFVTNLNFLQRRLTPWS
jgi:hypothetical protein